MENSASRFRVEVKLMDDPCLWRWDIRDELGGVIVQSSWDQEWTAYPSREEALRAGSERLTSVSVVGCDDRRGRWRFDSVA